jgi:membrane protease YdiL (CAAX protease family)
MNDHGPTPESPGQSPALPPPPTPLLLRIPPVPFAVLTLIVIFVLYQGIGGILTLVFFSARVTPENVDAIRWSTLGGQIIFLLLPTILIARLRYGRLRIPFRMAGLEIRQLLLLTIGLLSLQQLLQGYLVLQDMIPLPGPVQEFVDRFKEILESVYILLARAHTPGEFLVVVLVVALTPAICEELLFRGLIQRTFEEAFGGFRAAVIAGVIFGFYHINPFSLVPLCALGVYFGWVVYRSQNVTLAVFAHFLNNLFAAVVLYTGVDENLIHAVPGSAPSPFLETGFYLLSGVVFLVASYYFVEETKERVIERGED